MGNKPSSSSSYTVTCGGCSETVLYSGSSYSEYQDVYENHGWCGKCKKAEQARTDQLAKEKRDREYAQQQLAQQQQTKERERQHQVNVEKYRKEQQAKENDRQRQHQLDIEKERKALERIKQDAAAEQQRSIDQQKQYDREHKKQMEKIKIENERQKRLAAEAAAKSKREHEEKLKKMQIDAAEKDKQLKIDQKNQALEDIKKQMSIFNQQVEDDEKTAEETKEELERISKTLDEENKWIKDFDGYKKNELDKTKIQNKYAAIKKEFDDADKQVTEAINKTGQHSADVGRFLTLTHGLMGATIATTAQTDKLDIEMSTFGKIIGRECQDRLSIASYFRDNGLEKFIPILATEGYMNLCELICNNDDEFNESIINVIENGMIKQLELDKKTTDNVGDDDKKDDNDNDDDDDKDPAELGKELLTKWKLGKFYDTMIDEGWDDPNDWGDLEDNDLKDMGFKKGNINKFKKQYKKWSQSTNNSQLTAREKRVLQDICLKPQSTWQNYEKEKANATKASLMVVSPLLGDFFGKMHTGIKQSQSMLTYDTSLNNTQIKAIDMVNSLAPIDDDAADDDDDKNDVDDDNNDNDDQIDDAASGSTTFGDDNDDNDDISTDYTDPKLRKKWKIKSKVQVWSDSNKEWYDGTIIDIKDDNKGEWLVVKYVINKLEYKTKDIGRLSKGIREPIKANDVVIQCRTLTTAAIVSINVTDTMMVKFEKTSTTTRALTVARGVEDCCMQIMRSQGTIRQSVLLAQEILKLKPAYKSPEAVKLWNAVDDGIIHIFKCALEMVKISATYFAFFLRFKQSFNYYVSLYQNNKDISLVVSLEHLKQDIADFTAFKEKFNVAIKQLSDSAEQCITNCVKTHVGAKNYEKHRSKLETARQDWLAVEKIINERESELVDEYNQKQKDKIEHSAKKARLAYKLNTLQASIKLNKKYIKQYTTKKNELDKMII